MNDPSPLDPTQGMPQTSEQKSVHLDFDPIQHPLSIARYRIDGILGSGGFGIVYLGWDTELQRPVAIKVPNPGVVLQARDLLAYQAEARIMAKMNHPNIAAIYDVGTTATTPLYIVSRYISGGSLHAILRQRTLAINEATELIRVTAEALDYAHRLGLVHRDIKPGNIVLDDHRQPHLVDFGLAMSDGDMVTHLQAAGTPSYMSPEQARGEGHRVDCRADVFSLGVVFYQLLTSQKPFPGNNAEEVLYHVIHTDPVPPRQINVNIPREVDRICLRAMAKRVTDRYPTAQDFATDLQLFLNSPTAVRGSNIAASPDLSKDPIAESTPVSRATSNSNTGSSGATQPIAIVPRGLRAFNELDADFFPELLPGPRDRNGLPESIRFWKHRIETKDGLDVFSVGVIYGPSGCGKSSLMRAGIIPLLNSSITPIFVEAVAGETEARLTQQLKMRCSSLPKDATLKQIFTTIRRGQTTFPGPVLIVIDQFEQWLDSSPIDKQQELAEALRQCDGVNLQTILLVRDDFWMAASRLMKDLEIPLQEGLNCAAVDRFSARHARRVLKAFGQAFGVLPKSDSNLTRSQEQFLDAAIEGIAEDGRVVCVRLAVFAEMFRDREWSPAALKMLGGVEGVGVAFLEETFSSKSAPAEHRHHQQAARQVLQFLLPDSGSQIKGRIHSEADLLAISGYEAQPEEFRTLLHLLDHELRLITPAEATSATMGPPKRSYQLTHDFLIAPLRRWLSQKQRETLRGRAELLLEQLSTQWHERPQPQSLPTPREYLMIRGLVPQQLWKKPQREMMSIAGRRLSRQCGLIVTMSILAFVGIWTFQRNSATSSATREIVHAELRLVPQLLAQHAGIMNGVLTNLSGMINSKEIPADQQERARLILASSKPETIPDILPHLEQLDPGEIPTACDILNPVRKTLVDQLWPRAVDRSASQDQRLRNFAILARFDSESPRWPESAPWVAESLTGQNPQQLSDWIKVFEPVSQILKSDLVQIARSANEDILSGSNATGFLSVYAIDDPQLLTDVALVASPQQVRSLLPALRKQNDRIHSLLLQRFDSGKDAILRPDSDVQELPALTASVSQVLNEPSAMLTKDFALCHALLFSSLGEVGDELRKFGYRPVCVRPRSVDGRLVAAAIWIRDESEYEIVENLTAEEIQQRHSALHSRGMLPTDIARYTNENGEPRFVGIWHQPSANSLLEDADVYVEVPEDRHQDRWAPLNERGLVPKSNLPTEDSVGRPLFTSIRWKLRPDIHYKDCWNEDFEYVKDMSGAAWCQQDVRMTDAGKFEATWWNGFPYESTMIAARTFDEQLRQSKDLAAQGFFPISIDVAKAPAPEQPCAASVWHRPLPDPDAQIEAARSRASAALILLLTNDPEPFRTLIDESLDPQPAAFAVSLAQGFGVSPNTIREELRIAKTSQAIARLLLMLSSMKSDSMTDQQAQMLTSFSNSDDPFVRAAAELCIQRWSSVPGDQLVTHQAHETTSRNESNSWWMGANNHRMIRVAGPVEFQQGSPSTEAGRDTTREWMHSRRIPRSFAICDRETTVRQFLSFQSGFNFASPYSPTSDCPVNSTTWWDAIRYCRWLSEQENIPESEMCYPPVSNIHPGMSFDSRMLERTGYRLPTESEWEFACRAFSSHGRSFGDSEDLLDDYVWTVRNSEYRSHPVAQLFPNRFGLFDMEGNIMEWCLDGWQDYPLQRSRNFFDTDEQLLLSEQGHVTRGGAFLYEPLTARSAQRHRHDHDAHRPYIGFRIVRTLKSE